MVKNSVLSLRALSLSSATWYATVPIGWALVLLAGWHVVTTDAVEQPQAFIMTAGLLVILELLPLVSGRGHDPQGVVMSTAFLCAMLFVWGVWPAILSVGIASLAADLRARKQWWKVLFNPAQYAVSVGAAYLVIRAVHGPVGLDHALPRLGVDALLWVPAAWVVYYTVNWFIVCCVVSYTAPLRTILFDDFVHVTLMTFAVMAISPIVVVVAQHSWYVMPLLLIPLLLLYYTASMSLEREHAAGHDDLTGLPNRKTLRFELDNALATYEREGTPFGLMLIDMNDFKRVNDTLGHQVGDRLLVEFANRLRERVRPGDFVARLGGDEFAIIVHDADERVGRAVAQRVCESISHSIDVGTLSLEAEASVGIALCPAHGTDGGILMRRADVAMYTAKADRTRVEVYSTARDTNTADALALLGELRQALADDALELHYQPKVDTSDGTAIGVEALVRWRHPMRGWVPPDQFIPLAEGSGIMPALTERVIDLALAQIADWRDEGMTVPVAVNISPTDLVGSELPPGGRPRAARPRPDPGDAPARDHRAHRHRRGGRGQAQPRRAARHGGDHQPRRLRDGLLLVAAAQLAAGRRDQDRPWVHLGHVPGRPRRRDRPGPGRPRAHPGDARHRRGRRDRGRAADARVARLRRRPGLAPRPSDARRPGHDLAARARPPRGRDARRLSPSVAGCCEQPRLDPARPTRVARDPRREEAAPSCP